MVKNWLAGFVGALSLLAAPAFAQNIGGSGLQVPGGGGGGGSGTVTSVATDATLTGGPITTTGTLGINLNNPNTWTNPQSFLSNDLVVRGSSTGSTAFTSANAGASNFILTLPAITDTVVTLTATQTLTNKTFVAPVLGTPTSGNLANTTGYPNATSSTFGIVEPDNSTITISGGVISAVGGGSGCTVSGTVGQLVYNSGSAGCLSSASTITSAGLITVAGGGNNTAMVTLTPNSGNSGAFGMANGGGQLLSFINGVAEYSFASPDFVIRSDACFDFAATTTVTSTTDTFMCRKGAANLQLGKADAAAPVAQTFSVQNVVAGTSNTAGANLTINGSQSTGTGAGGSVIIQTAAAGTTGTSQNALGAALTINSAKQLLTANGSASAPVFAPAGSTSIGLFWNTPDLTYSLGGGNTNFCLCGQGHIVTSGEGYTWVSSATNAFGTPDTFIDRRSAANVLFGAADAAAPVAQTMSVQSVVAGTSNVGGANWTHVGSLSTGSGVSGDMIFQTGGTGAAATVQNTAVTALVIKGATQNVRLPAITSDAGLTDASVCEDTTNHALFAGSGTLGICLGTSSARYKHGIAPLGAGLAEIMRLKPISYYLNADHGDPTHELYGFTAEDMRPVLPKLVGLDAKGQPNTADYMGLIPVLVKAVQEQQVEIAALQAQVANDDAVLAEFRHSLIIIRAGKPVPANNNLLMPTPGYAPIFEPADLQTARGR